MGNAVAGLFSLTMKTVAINIKHIHFTKGGWKWRCLCEWCKWRPEPVDTLAECLRLARSHVRTCSQPYTRWEPSVGNEHEGWLIGMK